MDHTKSHQLHYIPHITTKRYTLRIMWMEVSSCISNLKYQSNTYSTNRPQQQSGFNDLSDHQHSVTKFLANKNNLATDTVKRLCVYGDRCTAMCSLGSKYPNDRNMGTAISPTVTDQGPLAQNPTSTKLMHSLHMTKQC